MSDPPLGCRSAPRADVDAAIRPLRVLMIRQLKRPHRRTLRFFAVRGSVPMTGFADPRIVSS